MKTKMISAVIAALMLTTASIGGLTASAAERDFVREDTTEISVVNEDGDSAGSVKSSSSESNSDSTDSSDDMEKYREVMSELAEAGTTEIEPNDSSNDYFDNEGNATLIKSEKIIYNTEEMQFIAVTTKDGHVFYVLINYMAANGEDNVYFLNNVRNTYGHYKLLE